MKKDLIQQVLRTIADRMKQDHEPLQAEVIAEFRQLAALGREPRNQDKLERAVTELRRDLDHLETRLSELGVIAAVEAR